MTTPPTPWLGVNYWSRDGGPRMWAHYDAATVAEELDTLAAHGLDTTRSFTVDVEIAADLVDAVTGEPVEPRGVVLGPFGVRVLRVTGER